MGTPRRIVWTTSSIGLLAVALAGGPTTRPETRPSAPEFLKAVAPREWTFPRDHGRHDGFKTEWWYFTGNVRDAGGRAFGYQLTFFRSAIAPPAATIRPSPWAMTDLYFAHAAVSDVDGRTFAFKDRLQRGRAGLAESSDRALDVSLLDWSARRDDDGTIRLKAAEADFAVDLTCTGGRDPVLQGPGGMNAKSREAGHASYYYSLTRLRTAGTLTVGGKAFRVEGLSWMDHEFFTDSLAGRQVGWDWMGLHLADGSDLMVYRLRDAGGRADYLSGTHVTPDGKPRYLSAADLSVVPAELWRSPKSGNTYPQKWALRVGGGPTLTVRSRMPGQELTTPDTTGVDYFEGAAAVTDDRGQPAGEGYLEMTGGLKPPGGREAK